MTCQTGLRPAPSVHMAEDSELSRNATLVTMQKASAIQSATLASPEPDQSAGSSASQVNTNVVPCARLTENHVVASSLKQPWPSLRQPSDASPLTPRQTAVWMMRSAGRQYLPALPPNSTSQFARFECAGL